MNPAEGILRSLLRYDRPPEELLAELEAASQEEWTSDTDEAEEELEVVFMPDDALAVLHQFVEGDLDAAALEAWSDVVCARDEVVFESVHEDALREFMSDVGHLTEASAEAWLGRFDDDE